MFSNRVASFLVVFSAIMGCKLVLGSPFALAQTIASRSYLSQAAAPRRPLQRGPVTPAEKVLKTSHGRSHKLHPFATQSTSPLSPIFWSALDYPSAGQSTLSVAAADLNGDSKTDFVLADHCNDNKCLNGSVSVLLGNGDGKTDFVLADRCNDNKCLN